MSVPPEPRGKGTAQWRGYHSRDCQDRKGGRGGRGRGRNEWKRERRELGRLGKRYQLQEAESMG
eukprot:3339888-Karenia_brevis.AAC.1